MSVFAEATTVEVVGSWFERFGLPLTILVLIVVATWKIGNKLATFFSPYVKRFMEAQLELLQKLEESTMRQADAAEQTAVTIQQLASAISLLNERHNKHDEVLTEIKNRLTQDSLRIGK